MRCYDCKEIMGEVEDINPDFTINFGSDGIIRCYHCAVKEYGELK